MSISVAIVIPAYREATYIEKTLVSIEKSVQYSIEKNWIPRVIVVVNNPTGVSDSFRRENQLLIQSLMDLRSTLSFPLDVLDYTDPGIKNGVGEARKIGMNYAIAKYLNDPKDLIVSLDADCTVELNYVSALFQIHLKGSAFTLYFEHALDSESIIFYELYIRYLRWGHIKANSPFAHYSVGSSLGTNVENYTKIGGMTPRSATEDFHFLNKLRRQGPIQYNTSTTVKPSSRQSERVTLGTGYFLTKSKTDFEQAFSKLMLPHPADFEKLKSAISILENFDGTSSLNDLFQKNDLSDVYQDLHKNGVIEKIYKIFETTTQVKIYQNRIMEVFDGLETLRTLRSMWIKNNNHITKEMFMDWCNQLWETTISSPKEMLLHVRKLEKEL
jgi:hypothetical protein